MRRLSRFSVAVTLSPPASDTDRGPALGAAAAPAGPGFQRPSSEAKLRGPLAGSALCPLFTYWSSRDTSPERLDRRVQSQALKRVLPRWPHFGRQPGSPFSLAPELAARTEPRF